MGLGGEEEAGCNMRHRRTRRFKREEISSLESWGPWAWAQRSGRGSSQADNHLKPRVLSLLWPLQTQPSPKQLRAACCIGSGLPQAPGAKDSKTIKSVKVSASERSPQRGDVALTCLEQHRKSCHNYFQLSSHFLGGLHRVISVLTTTFSHSCEKQSKPQI